MNLEVYAVVHCGGKRSLNCQPLNGSLTIVVNSHQLVASAANRLGVADDLDTVFGKPILGRGRREQFRLGTWKKSINPFGHAHIGKPIVARRSRSSRHDEPVIAEEEPG